MSNLAEAIEIAHAIQLARPQLERLEQIARGYAPAGEIDHITAGLVREGFVASFQDEDGTALRVTAAGAALLQAALDAGNCFRSVGELTRKVAQLAAEAARSNVTVFPFARTVEPIPNDPRLEMVFELARELPPARVKRLVMEMHRPEVGFLDDQQTDIVLDALNLKSA